MCNRFISFSDFREGLKQFTADNYINPSPKHSPLSYLATYSFFEVPRFNCARYRQYAKILLKDAASKGCDTKVLQEQIDRFYETEIVDPQKPVFILNFINSVFEDPRTADKVSVLPLVCGAGKSTAISHLIRQVIERNDGKGILIVTDSKERMTEYVKPKRERDPELRAFLDVHKNGYTVLTGETLAQGMKTHAKRPVLVMTMQRYFSLSTEEIRSFLQWGEGGTRPLVLFDEAIYLTKVEKISRRHFNNVSTALNEGIHWTDDPALRQRCIDYWENVRERIWAFIKETEAGLNRQDYYRYYAFGNGTLTGSAETDEEFMSFIDAHREELARYDLNIGDEWHTVETIYMIKRMLTEGCLFHCGKRGAWYEGSFSIMTDNREKVTDTGAKVIVMDGTAEIHPDYQQDYIDMRDGGKYERSLDNLSLRFVGGLKTDKTHFEDHQKKLMRLVAAYMREAHSDTSIAAFTYDSTENEAKEYFDATAHFGAIKGRNEFGTYTCIAQIGIFRFPESYYLTYFFWQNRQHLEAIRTLDLEQTAAYINDVMRSREYQEIVTRFLLADLEQNMFRCAIRQSDFVDPAYYYVFCDAERYELLFECARNKYGLYNADVRQLNGTEYFLIKQIEVLPEGKVKNEYKLRYWIYKLPSGTLFSTRRRKVEGEACRLMLTPEESGVTHDQYKKVKENTPEFAEYMQTMAVPGRNSYFIRP